MSDARRSHTVPAWNKILLGATVLAKIERGELDQQTVNGWLDSHLTRADDRALFELPRVASPAGSAE